MDDIIVVGGSFAGLATALQMGRARRKVTVLDTGLPRNRFAAHSHGLLGHDHKNPADILAEARAQLQRYPSVRIINVRATSASGEKDNFAVSTDDGETLRARRLVLSYGVSDQMPTIPGFAESWGKSVVPCPYCDGFEVADKHWGSLYAGPMSLHSLVLYGHWTDKLTLFTDGHDLSQDDRDRVAARGTRIVDGKVTAIPNRDGQLSGITLADGKTVPIDVLFAHPQNRPSANLHTGLGLETVETPVGLILKVDDRRETSLEGVYAAGDLANGMASVTLASSQGAMAGVFAQQSLLDW